MKKSITQLRLAPMYLALSAALPVLAAPAAGSEYLTDKAHVYVSERSASAFASINNILCMVGQTKYAELVNTGDYRAQVDEQGCSGNSDSPSDAASSSEDHSSGNGRPSFMDWTVSSTRADDASPQIVKFWINQKPEEGNGSGKLIMAKLVVTEAASANNQYGIFALDYEGYGLNPDGSMITPPSFKGHMQVQNDGNNQPVLSFYDENMESNGPGPATLHTEKAALKRNPDLSGTGIVDGEGGVFNIAFNDSFFRRSDGTTDACYSRTLHDETAWSYALYNSDNGSRIKIDSGFPVKATVGGKELHGWVGYWGLWFQDNAVLNNGDTVIRQSFGPNPQETSYTLFKAPGKLQKHVLKHLLLDEIAGVPIDWNVFSNNQQTTIQIVWDKLNQKFVKVRQLVQDSNTGQSTWTDISGDLTSNDLVGQFELHGWSKSLGGNLSIRLRDNQQNLIPLVGTSVNVTIDQQTAVMPGDVVPASLACYNQCPDAANITSSNPYKAPGEQSYSFDGDAMVLLDGSSPVALTQASQGNFQYGVMSGPLFENSPANIDLLKCDWNPNEVCAWKAWQVLDTFYTWETGPRAWNQLTLLKDAQGGVLHFDPPLSVVLNYTNPDLGYDNTKFYLEYSGFGNLQGIPGHCIDPETNQPSSCGPDKRWIPQFTIDDGTTVTNDAATTSYLVKALEKEQRMSKVDNAQCSVLTFGSLTLPDNTTLTSPNIGDQPVVTGSPAVIGGVIQGQP